MTSHNPTHLPMPALGFGTFELSPPVAEEMVEQALNTGYRHIDTAQMYKNEEGVGRGLRRSGIDRKDIWLTTKIWINRFRDGDLQQSVEQSLERLQTDYVDLVLLHWPNPRVPLAESINALNQVQQAGKARHIGISNFNTAMIEQACQLSGQPLYTNQVEYHPYLDQSNVLASLARQHMKLTAYSPLAQGQILDDETLLAIGRRHGKNTAQVCLRWLIQQDNVTAIPRSGNADHARSNFDIFDFELNATEMQAIHQLARPDGRVIDPAGLAPDWD